MHFFDESFWIAVSFIIFLYFAYQPIRKGILASLDTKINEIKIKLKETEKIKHDAQILLEEIERETANFKIQKEQMIEKAKANTTGLVAFREQELDLLLTRKKESAIQSIENQKLKASEGLREEFVHSVTNLIHNYFIETANQKELNEEIIQRFTATK